MATPTYRIMGIDPGINTTGWSIGQYDPATQKTHVTAYGTIEASTLARKEMRQENKTFGTVVSLFLYEREFRSLFENYKPSFVASEDAFMHRFPQAFVSLKLCIATIRRILFTEYRQLLYLIPPKSAKLAVWGNGMADKEAVQEGILRLPDLTIKSTKQRPVSDMVEHEADSIAILYTFVKNILPDILLQNKK